MSTSRRQRILGALVGTIIPALFVGPLLTAASTPSWGMVVSDAIPTVVKNGASAGWVVTISNSGPSNIASLYLGTNIPAGASNVSPTYISAPSYSGQTGPANPCNAAGSGPLYCSFGDLRAGGSVRLTIAFATPASGSSWSFKFQAYANGATPSDRKGTSRGDFLEGTASVGLNSNRDFAGGFSVDAGFITTDTNLSRSNPQSSGVKPPSSLLIATIQDGLTSYPGGLSDPCPALDCFGEWTRLTVKQASGSGYSGAAFKVVLTILGREVPGGANAGNINVYHDGDGVIGDSANERCASENDYSTNGGAPCVWVEKIGQNYRIVVWLTHNGSLRGNF